jgi:hypothetical protein
VRNSKNKKNHRCIKTRKINQLLFFLSTTINPSQSFQAHLSLDDDGFDESILEEINAICEQKSL